LLLFSLDIVHIFVWFSNDRRLAIVVRVAAVFLILFILVIVGVLWRHRGADQAQREKMLFEMPGVMFVSRWMIMVNSSILPACAAAPGAWRKWLRCAALRRA
jgi:membrane protein YdbS with pleckstrin-like domain